MYIHRIFIDHENAKKRNLYDEYSFHKLIYSQFPISRSEEDISNSLSSGFLWHHNNNNHNGHTLIAVSDRPAIATLDVKVESKQLNDSYFGFKQYRFQILVNPMYQDSKTKKRYAYTKHEDITQWFQRTSAKSGFEPAEINIDLIKTSRIKKNGAWIKLVTANISGTIIIKDHEKFKETFFKGYGRAKSFGCGLLQIIPIL